MVVLDEDNLCPYLEFEFKERRQHGFGKFALYLSTEYARVAIEVGEVLLVDVVHHITACRKGDEESSLLRDILIDTGVEQLEVMGRSGVGADMVENVDEDVVVLTIHFGEFYGHEFHFVEHTSREEVGCLVVALQYLSFVTSDNGFKLEHIAHKEHLLSSKR